MRLALAAFVATSRALASLSNAFLHVHTSSRKAFHVTAGEITASLPPLNSCSTDSDRSASDITVEDSEVKLDEPLDPQVCQDFRINVCSSTSCAQKRQILGLDEYATFSGIYTRAAASATGSVGIGGSGTLVEIEESTCIGSCKLAPCVSVEHEDFIGTVGLDGMTNAELSARAFHSVITEDDLDRVWEAVENAIRTMSDEDEEDEIEDNEEHEEDSEYKN